MPPPPPALGRSGFYAAQIRLGLVDYARRCGFHQVVIGLSGGIDSALTAVLAAEALGPSNVTAVAMPSAFSSAGSVVDSQQLCDSIGVKLHVHPIQKLVESFGSNFECAFSRPLQGVAHQNLQARIRGTVLMAYSNEAGHLLLTTGNKSEIAVGYCTLYGDTNGGLGLIGDIYKTEVFSLARYINDEAGYSVIAEAIIAKPPSAELAPNQLDTDSLPEYSVLDTILKWIIEGVRLPEHERAEIEMKILRMNENTQGRALIARVRRLVAASEYKRRQSPPSIMLRPQAFGRARLMPIAAVYS